MAYFIVATTILTSCAQVLDLLIASRALSHVSGAVCLSIMPPDLVDLLGSAGPESAATDVERAPVAAKWYVAVWEYVAERGEAREVGSESRDSVRELGRSRQRSIDGRTSPRLRPEYVRYGTCQA